MVKIQNNYLIAFCSLKCLIMLALTAVASSDAPANAANAANTVDIRQPNKTFVVIDSIRYRDKGDLLVYGMKPYTLLYSIQIWAKNILKTNKHPEKAPSDEYIADLVRNVTAATSPVVYDIEHWPLDIRKAVPNVADDDIDGADSKTVAASMNKMIHIMDCSRKANPSVKYGYYGCVPLRDYWAPVKNDPELLKKWRAANDYLKPLADSQDVICPSLYCFFPDREAWVTYAKANIAEAKRLANGKPVYAFLWPKYHNSNKKDGKKFIEGDFWRLQLETVYNSGVDGVIIWDSPRVVNNKDDSVWNPDREWWKETIAFLKRIQK